MVALFNNNYHACLACEQALSRGAGGLLAGYTCIYKVSRNVTRKVTDLCSVEQNNRDPETFLSTRTSNNPGETGSTPAFLTCLIALSQCYITATLFVVLMAFSLFFQFRFPNYNFFQNDMSYAFPMLRSKIVFS